MKKFVFDNTDYRTHEEQQAAVERYLTWRNRQRDISETSWPTYRRRAKKAG